MLCWGCARAAPTRVTRSSVPFQVCTLCREEGCEPCAFCSTECLRDNWPRHREWHREQRRLFSLAESAAARHWSAAPHFHPVVSPYDELLNAASALDLGATASGSPQPALVAGDQSDLAQAIRTYIGAVERMSSAAGARPLAWAERAVSAYALLADASTAELAHIGCPSWWSDESLKNLSAAVLEARPDYVLAWRFRGEVLSALLGGSNWGAVSRVATDLAEAGRCLQRAATLGHHELAPADKEQVVRQAVACFRAAQAAAQTESHSRMSSGSATPTGGRSPGGSRSYCS